LKRFSIDSGSGIFTTNHHEPSRIARSCRLCSSWLIALLVLVFSSCATAPRAPAPAVDDIPELSLLPAGGRVYLWADTVQGRPLLELLSFDGMSMDGRDAAMMLDRTSSAAAVLFPEGEDRRFFLAAAGRYPRHRANFSFAFSRGWRRQRGSGGTFWYSRGNNIAVSLGANLALVSNIDPLEDLARESPPQTFAEFRRGMVLAGWVHNPSDPINSFLETLGLPIQLPAEDFFFGASRAPYDGNNADTPWELAFRIRAPSETHARSLLVLFSTARFFVMMMGAGEPSADADSIGLQELAMMLFANVPEQDGEFLTLRINSLNENTIALLFDIFSVYSN